VRCTFNSLGATRSDLSPSSESGPRREKKEKNGETKGNRPHPTYGLADAQKLAKKKKKKKKKDGWSNKERSELNFFAQR
jgi:hypothetical protein